MTQPPAAVHNLLHHKIAASLRQSEAHICMGVISLTTENGHRFGLQVILGWATLPVSAASGPVVGPREWSRVHSELLTRIGQ